MNVETDAVDSSTDTEHDVLERIENGDSEAVIGNLSWNELQAAASELGLYENGDTEDALRAKLEAEFNTLDSVSLDTEKLAEGLRNLMSAVDVEDINASTPENVHFESLAEASNWCVRVEIIPDEEAAEVASRDDALNVAGNFALINDGIEFNDLANAGLRNQGAIGLLGKSSIDYIKLGRGDSWTTMTQSEQRTITLPPTYKHDEWDGITDDLFGQARLAYDQKPTASQGFWHVPERHLARLVAATLVDHGNGESSHGGSIESVCECTVFARVFDILLT